MLNIRPFERTEAEYRAVIEVHNAVWLDHPTTLEEWKHFEETADPECLYRELVAEQDGQIVGHVFYCQPWWWSKEPGRFFFDLIVHPDHQSRGVGGVLYEVMLHDLDPHQPRVLSTRSREDQDNGLGFLKSFGYEQAMRFPRSILRVSAFDFDRFDPLFERLGADGVVIRTLPEVQQSDPDWKQKFYELRWEILQDVPSSEARKKPTLEEFEQRTLNNPELLPDANFFALDGDRFVGYSNLWPTPNPEKLNTGLSGVARSHRRRKICTALKVCGIRFARQYGAKEIETENEENNPMYPLNLALGFEPQPAWLDFRKVVCDEVEAGDGMKAGAAK